MHTFNSRVVLGALLGALAMARAGGVGGAGACSNYSDPDAQHACRMFGNDDIGSPSKPRAPSFGAIAVGSDGAFGWSYEWNNRAGAEKVALSECQKRGKRCTIAVWFYDRCGAVAIAGNGRFGAEHAPSGKAAARAALASCRKDGGVDCQVKQTICSF